MDKVISIPTAKEMWKALKEMHEGSEELKRSKKFALEGEFHTFKMVETESITEYYSRFTRLVAKLTAAGVTLDDVSKSLVIINGLNSKFSLIIGILKNTPGGQSLPLTQIIGKLEVEEEGEQGKESSTKKAEKGIALKISKAFSRIELEEENSDIEEETDEMTALFAKHIKKNFNKGKSGNLSKRKMSRTTLASTAMKMIISLKAAPRRPAVQKMRDNITRRKLLSLPREMNLTRNLTSTNFKKELVSWP